MPDNANDFNLALGQGLGFSPILLGIIVLIVSLLIMLALIYFNKYRLKLQTNQVLGDSNSIRYQSNISLCSLALDQLNSILYISHGRKVSQIGFAQIGSFEVLLNTNRLLKIDRNGALTFNDKTEESLRSTLGEVDLEELLEDQTRQLELQISYELENEINSFPVNFYYREGSHRISHNSFATSVDDLIFWCGFLTSAMHPSADEELDNTEIDATESLNMSSREHEKESLNLSNQADVDPRRDSKLQPAPELKLEPEPQPAPDATQTNQVTNLADQLVKLAELNARGILSDAEFQKIKNRIIN